MQGQSVLSLFAGETATAYEGADQVGYELFGMRAYFAGDWKILLLPEPVGKGDWELFNLKEDPAELDDLSDTYPDKRAELIAGWERYEAENGVL